MIQTKKANSKRDCMNKRGEYNKFEERHWAYILSIRNDNGLIFCPLLLFGNEVTKILINTEIGLFSFIKMRCLESSFDSNAYYS